MFFQVLHDTFRFLVRSHIAFVVPAAVIRHNLDALFNQPIQALLQCRVHGRYCCCKSSRIETVIVDCHFPVFSETVLSAFFDVLVEVRDKHGFEYADDCCIELAKKIKTLIDDTAIYADWLNNDNLKSKLASQLTYLLYKEGYPPQWDEEVFQKVLEQVENYKKHE